jgi:hypothetical protein
MATLPSAKRNTTGFIDSGYKSFVRTIDFIVDLSKDVTMANATDDIQLATLPGGTTVVAAGIQQVVAGTGSGTLALRVGTTAVTGTLQADAAVGTWGANLPAATPLVVAAAGAELNLLGATATRLVGKVRVTLTVVEGDRSPREATVAQRDASL